MYEDLLILLNLNRCKKIKKMLLFVVFCIYALLLCNQHYINTLCGKMYLKRKKKYPKDSVKCS